MNALDLSVYMITITIISINNKGVMKVKGAVLGLAVSDL